MLGRYALVHAMALASSGLPVQSMASAWNPHVERLREAGFPRPWAMYETLIREPDALGRSVTRLVDLCIEAMERARKNVEDAREAARAHACALRLEISTAAACNGELMFTRSPAVYAASNDAPTNPPPREYEARPRSKSGQRAAERRAKGWR